MAVLELQTLTDGSPHYSMRVQLDGADYVLSLRFGERRNAWMLDLVTLDGVDILTGQLVTVGRDLLLRAHSITECPPGMLFAVNGSVPSAEEGGLLALPGLYDLGPGGRCRLFYTEIATLEAADA